MSLRTIVPEKPSAWLRAAVLAGAAVLLSFPLTVPAGLVTAALGAVAGAWSGEAASRTRLRSAGAILLGAALCLLGLGVAHLLVASSLAASLVGAIPALWWSEGVRWLGVVAGVVFTLRFLAVRRPAAAVLEVAAVIGAVVASVAAHREGMVHRPLALGDWAWSRGIDPALPLLVIGVVGVLLLGGLLLAEERRRRLPLHFAGLLVLAAALLLLVRVEGLPQPQRAGDLGLTGDPAEPQPGEGQGGGGGGKGGDQLGDLRFQDEYSASGGEAPVAVVVFHDDYSPPSGVYYFRQSAFSQYNGRRLVLATRDDVDRDIVRRFPVRPLAVPGAPSASAERTPLPTTVGLMVDHVRPFALDSPVRYAPADNPDPLRFQRAFEALSNVQTVPYEKLLGRRPGDPDWSDEQWRHYTEAPQDPRYAELADEIVGVLRPEYRRDPLAEALAVKGYLDKQGTYSRRSQHASSDDPTGSFLFGDLTGYCVHFAHAAAFLLRSRGVPTRVAAGYALPESARGGGSALMIRGLNAHAWPEIYLEGLGWVVVDISPERSLDEPSSPPDQALQRMLGEMMRRPSQRWQPFDETASRWTVAGLARFLAWALLALVAVAYAVKVERRLAPRFVRPTSLYRVGYRAALDRLAEVGLARRLGETREAFARRAVALTPAMAPLTAAHLGGALGSRRRTPPGELRRLVRGVAAELRRSAPGWKRWLGVLDPVSWWRAR